MVKAGANVTLEAEVYGKPFPTVSWKFNGEAMKKTDGMKMKQNRHLFTLELFSVARKETGEYTIVAENSSGSKSANFKVKVLGK